MPENIADRPRTCSRPITAAERSPSLLNAMLDAEADEIANAACRRTGSGRRIYHYPDRNDAQTPRRGLRVTVIERYRRREERVSRRPSST